MDSKDGSALYSSVSELTFSRRVHPNAVKFVLLRLWTSIICSGECEQAIWSDVHERQSPSEPIYHHGPHELWNTTAGSLKISGLIL